MADTVGNLLGPRAVFEYTTDALEVVSYVADRSVGLAVGNPLATNPGRPTSVNSKYLRGRYVLLQLQSDPNVKKRVVIAESDNTLFAADSSQTVTINSVVWQTTGRVGERVSFLAASEPEE